MPRIAVEIKISISELKKLKKLSTSRKESRRISDRALIILECLSGKENQEVAKNCGTRPNTVCKWRNRFAKFGFAGLEDSFRSGKPKQYKDMRVDLLSLLGSPAPKRQVNWDG